jgi:F-type H+-transporting ATPase subunit b
LAALTDIGQLLVLAAAKKEEGGSFLVSPNVGLMLWTLIAFGASYLILRKYAFPRIADFLDKRAKAIADSIEAAERTKSEADELLEEYRARLTEAREQAEDIVARARKAGQTREEESKLEAKQYREELMASTRRDIEAETRRALDEIRKEVADLTLIATEKVMRKSLDGDDHRRLIEEALSEVDFSALSGEKSSGGGNGGAGG